jgi:hypothetical protein
MRWRPDKMICEYEIDGITISGRKIHRRQRCRLIYHHRERANLS